MVDTNNSQRSSAVLRMEAEKSEKPYLYMIIAGGISAVVALTLFIVSIVMLTFSAADYALDNLNKIETIDLSLLGNEAIPGIVLFFVSWFLALAAVGLLGPGIPLFIITKKRKKRALLELGRVGK